MLNFILTSLLFILPAYFANSIPVITGGGLPIDLNKKFLDNRRIFGNGKTFRGFIAGILAAIFISLLEFLVLSNTSFDLYGANPINYLLAGFLLGGGAMFGDLIGSFIKRRLGIGQGKPSIFLDQLSFLFFAIIFSYPFSYNFLSVEMIIFLSVLTYFIHIFANIIANKLGLKKVPW
jgi:CDP-2,3-bis-(O-geranylgeranyl)-sn-glycerol synthase